MEDLLNKDRLHEFLHKQYNNNNSFIANLNALSAKLTELLELNDKLPRETIDALLNIIDHIDMFISLFENLGTLEFIYTSLPELRDLYEGLETLPGLVDNMLKEVNDALTDWDYIETNILTKLEDIKGIFTSVKLFTTTNSTVLPEQSYLQVPYYSYENTNIVVLLNGVSTREFIAVPPVTSGSNLSEFIQFTEAIPINTQIVVIIFTSPDVVSIPNTIIHDNTLVGDGIVDSPLGVNPDTTSGITVNSNDIAALQNRMNIAESNITNISDSSSNNGTAITSINEAIAALPTVDAVNTMIDAATPERTYVSNVEMDSSSTSGTLTISTLTSKGNTDSYTNAVPIASSTQAGIMPASTYTQIISLQAQIDGLTGSSITVIDDTIPTTASQTDLTTAWNNTTYPLVNGSTLENNTLGLRWIYRNSTWFGPYTFTSEQLAGENQLGIVKGVEDIVDNRGQIFVEQDGSMTLIGYDDIIAKYNTLSSTLSGRLEIVEVKSTNNATAIATLNTKTDTTNTNLTSLINRVTSVEQDLDNYRAIKWQASLNLTSPYISGTEITIPTYVVGEQALKVFVNGVRTDRFTEVSTTSISLMEGMVSAETIQLIVDCYEV